MYYGPTYNWSSTGVATANTVVSTECNLPMNILNGGPVAYSLVVIANGIASDPVTFDGPVWVQYGLPGPGNGTYATPYNTLALATSFVPVGGNILFKYPGSTPEKPRIGTPMTIGAVGGPATIGRAGATGDCPNVMIDGITILQGYHSCQPSRPRGPCRAPQPTCSKLWSTVSPGEADRRQGINLDSSAGLTMKLVRRTDEIWADEDMRPPVLRLKRTVHSCRSVFYVAGSLAVLLVLVPATAGETKPLRGHVPGAVTDLHPIGRLSATNYLHLAIGLPLRDSAGLKHLLEQLYDPASHKFHQFLTPEQFTERFGPSAADYQAVINFARSNALTVTATHPNRALVDVTSSVADVERAFHVKMLEYRHPRETAPSTRQITIPRLALASSYYTSAVWTTMSFLTLRISPMSRA